MASAPLALLAATAACDRPQTILLGYAYARPSPDAADVAQEALDESAKRGGPAFRIVRWPAEGTGGLTKDIQGAVYFARMKDLAGVVGHSGSRESLLGAPVYNQAGLPQIVPTGTSRKLAGAGPWTFRLAPSDSVEGDVLAAYLVDTLGAKSATVFYFADEYGIGLRDGVMSGLARRGARIADQISLPTGSCPPLAAEDAYEAVVRASLRRVVPDAIVLAGRRVDGGCVMRLVHAAHPDLPFVGGDGVQAASPELHRIAGPAVANLHAAVFWLRDSEDSLSRDFRNRYRRLVGSEPEDSDAMVYDALLVLAAAARASGSDRRAIRRWLESLGNGREPWLGVTGPVSFRGERRAALHLVRATELVTVP